MRKKLMLLLPVALLFLVSGCSVWEDFSTYFNLYYNTSDAFDQAEQAIKESQKDPFSLVEMPLPGNAQTQIAKVIEKCSKILQFNANSSYVDDALLMIGKCFYYQKTYLKALRKFQELESSHPESSLFLESELWHAKTDIQLRNNERGLKLLVAVKEEAIKKGKSDIATDAFIEEIRYYLVLQDYEKVQSLCALLLSYSSDSSLKAKVAYELGDINEKQDKIEAATEAYASVRDYTASYDLLFNASIKYARMLIKLNQPEKALHQLISLKHEVKYRAGI
jgi:tetratricopeptide (TPR) repeat protein